MPTTYLVPTFISASEKARRGIISPRICSWTAPSSRKQTPLKVRFFLLFRRVTYPITKGHMSTGNKKDNVTIIYTPWSNLHKNAGMAIGQVGFHNPKLTRKVHVAARQNVIVNRLNKTRVEKFPDLRLDKEEYMKNIRREERKLREEKRAAEKQEKKKREELKWQKEHAYDDFLNEDNIQQSSNQDRDPDFLDDFM